MRRQSECLKELGNAKYFEDLGEMIKDTNKPKLIEAEYGFLL